MAYTTIDDPSDYFNTVLYTGNGSTQSITGVGFEPDWVWIKSRGDTSWHRSLDSSRGATKELYQNETNAENTESAGLTSFDSDGFSLGSNAGYNGNTVTFVAWNWIANGGTTSSNTSGSITSTVQANTTSGFSIITYTGNATDDATFGHGLGAVPHFIIIKRRNSTNAWTVYHRSQGADKALFLNTTAAVESSSFYQATPTSTLITLNDHSNVNNESGTYICYCFTEIQGYSKFGTYVGNGNADGTFIYTGFKPAWVMVKNISTTGWWNINDHKRPGHNPTDDMLAAQSSNAEADEDDIDLLSNGFKQRSTGGDPNGSGETFVYAAFAEQPFVTSGGVPCTAF